MKAIVRLAAFLALAASMAGSANAQTAVTRSGAATISGTVQDVDYASRVVTIRGDQGNLVTLDVPASVTQFDALRVGDVVTASYADQVSLRRKAAGEPVVDRLDPQTNLRTATVTVTAVDPVGRTMTFAGPKSRQYTRRIASTVDAQTVGILQPGDRLDISWYDTVVITKAYQPTPAPSAAAGTGVDHAWTVSVLVGPDNQFSGKMIKAGSGTLNGVPISFGETTYDEVYGRQALWKFSLGRRISPRSEVVGSLVLSRSSSEAVRVGRIGAEDAPVTAKFDDYSYWGIEAGQRFYFARVRFTPFVGYYIGLNRIDRINATFTAPAEGTQPALDLQDAEFYDAAWAFSFGPTGGVLVGLGPFEVMGQVELRYMGGLSDVDPLGEAGLKDINSESSRWSIPFLFGGRIRF